MHKLKEALDEILQLRADIRKEVLEVETDIKERGNVDYLQRVHSKKTYQSMGLTMAEQIIRKKMEAI